MTNPHHQRFFEDIPEGILILDPESSTVVELNSRLCSMLGVDRGDLVGRRIEETTIADTIIGFPTIPEARTMAKTFTRRRVMVGAPSGGGIRAELASHLYEIDGRSFIRCHLSEEYGFPRDVRSASEAIATARSSLLDSLPLGCQIIDTDWRYVYVNAEAARHGRAISAKLLGRMMSECYPGIERTPLYAAIAEVMYDRVRKHFAHEFEYPDGSKRAFDLVMFPVEAGVFILSVDLTEHRQAEEATAHLAAIVESSGEAIIGKTLDGVITSWNPGAERLYGYSAAEVIGKPVSILVPHGREDELPEKLERIRSGERIPPYETLRMRKDGGRIDVLLSVSPVLDREGRVESASAFALDITARKKAELAARESNERFEMIANTIENTFWIADPSEGRIIYVSPAYERVYGQSRTALYERPESFFEAIHPEDRRRVMHELLAQEEGLPFSHDFRFYRSDGSLRWINNRGYPLPGGEGNGLRYVGVAQDITARKATEERIAEQARLLDVASDLIVVTGTDNRIRYWNRSAARVFGLTREEALGRHIFETVHPVATPEKLAEILKTVYASGEWSGDMDYATTEGRTYTMLTRLTLVRDKKGKPTAVLAVSTDVTEVRLIERQFLRAQRLESLGSLAGGIAHDLNNVLAPIIMATESLSLRNPDTAERRVIEIIRTSAQRGAAIVRQILSFARGAEGEHIPVQLQQVIREIEGILSETFPKTIDVRIDVPRDLWVVSGDSTQIHQIVMNICVNARDAMPDGGILRVSASNVRLDETYARMHIEARPIAYVVVEVSDSGLGMPQGVQEKIFDPFFTTKEPGKGTGLGLSTALSIVKGHGGFINVYSEPGKGASFRIYLPAVEEEASQAESDLSEGLPMGNGELVIVADDEEPVREITREILESYSYRVVAVEDGTEALVSYLREQAKVCVMVIDIMMPHLDGTATIRALRKINPELRIIATSGLLTNEQSAALKGLGVNAFLAKPYTADTLLRTLGSVISGESLEPSNPTG